MEKIGIPIWRKASLNVEEISLYTGIGQATIRALMHAARHKQSDFPVFLVGDVGKVSRPALDRWLDDAAISHRDIKRAAKVVEDAPRKVGRPRKVRG